MQIGELATKLGLNTKTIRYYEKIGLLPPPERSKSGYRLYDLSDLERLQFILKAKTVGLQLAEIAKILSLRDDNQNPCEQVLSIVKQKITEIDEQLCALQELQKDLLKLRNEAKKTMRHQGNICSIIEEHNVVS